MYGARNQPGSPTLETDEAAEHDPYDLVPDDFCDNYDADTIPEALRKAERANSTTSDDERPRCPACGSVCYHQKTATTERCNQQPEPYRCIACNTHFETPDPPPAERDE